MTLLMCPKFAYPHLTDFNILKGNKFKLIVYVNIT